jgi:RNA-directed DNA polymerase
VKKRRGGFRDIFAPATSLRIMQDKLLQVLNEVYRPRGCVHGFVRDRSILSNAIRHVQRAWVLNVDLKDFFPSINFGRVRGMFMASPYRLPAEAATALAQVCCHENQLPQGAPTSPIVANMVCARLDGELLALAKVHRVTYTRFADDLTFSTNQSSFPVALALTTDRQGSGMTTLGPALDAVLAGNGFAPNLEKLRLQHRTARQEVTGLNVNRTPNVHRTYVRQIRAMLHAWERFGLKAAAEEFHRRFDHKHRWPNRHAVKFEDVVEGKIAFLQMVRGDGHPIATALRARFGKVAGRPPRVHPSLHERIRSAMWVLESVSDGPQGAEVSQGTAFELAGVGVITCAHTLTAETEAFREDQTERRPARVLFSSEEMDLALIDLGPMRHPLPLASSYVPVIWADVIMAGFPNFRPGDSGYLPRTHISGHRVIHGHLRWLVGGPVVQGMSGGPALSDAGEVVGVVSTGAGKLATANETEWHGFIPIATVLAFIDAAARAGVVSGSSIGPDAVV